MTEGPEEPKPHLWRWQYVLPASAIVVGALLTVVVRSDGNSTAAPSTTISSVTDPTSAVSTSASTTTSTPTPPGPRLGRELMPLTAETCRSPGFADGSAWHTAPVRVGGKAFEHAYVCNLFAGGTGSLDFVLSKSYRSLDLRIGFADDSGSQRHQVRFEVIADDSVYVAEPVTLSFGDFRDIRVDLRDRSRLKLRITEMTKAAGSEAPSKPVWAGGILTPA